MQPSSVVNHLNDVDEFQVQISSDGSAVYTGNAQIPGTGGTVAANAQVLYNNQNGQLTQVAQTTLDEVRGKHPGYLVSTGVISKDFTLSALLVIPPLNFSPTPTQGTAYVMFYSVQSNSFVFQKEYAITNFLVNFPYLNVGKNPFTEGNNYFVFSYCPYEANFSTVPGVIEVIDVTSLSSISSAPTYSYCTGPEFFSYKEKTYLLAGSGNLVGVNFLQSKFVSSQVQIFSFSSTLSLNQTIPQPQQITSVSINKALYFTVTMSLTLEKGQPTIYNLSQLISTTQTFINGEDSNLRVYYFSEEEVSLVYQEHLDTNINCSYWKNEEEFALILQAGTVNLTNAGVPAGSTFSTITQPNVLILCSFLPLLNQVRINSFPQPVPPLALVDFSQDGQWMVVGGGGLPYPSALASTALYDLYPK